MSMIRYLEHKEIDRQLWDQCIERAPNGMIYATSWYLDIVAPKQWDALVLGEYDAVFPLTWNRKLGIYYLYQPFFTQQLGVFGMDALALLPDFIHAIPARFLKVEISLNTLNVIASGPGFTIVPARTHHLLLKGDYEQLLAGYSDNGRRNLKKARKQYPEKVQDSDVASMISLFRETVGKKTAEIRGRHYDMLHLLLDECRKRELLYCSGFKDESGKLLAGTTFLRYKNSLIYLLGAARDEVRDLGALQLLMDDCIHAHANSGLLLDFEGSDIPGIARFFKNFGAHEVNYYRLRMNRLPLILRLLKK
jgi:hypothetical protein